MKYSPLVLALFLAGCGALDTPYQVPKTVTAAQWTEAATGGQALGADWWKAFRDPALDALIAEALSRNNDLAIAAIRVSKARATAGIADDQRLPQFSASASAEGSRTLSDPRVTARQSGTSASAAWEIDLWNKLGREADAAHFEAAATEEDLNASALSLVGTVADLYWTIAYLNERIDLARQSIAYAEKTLALVENMVAAGGASDLELAEAQYNLENQRASLHTLLQQRTEQRNALAILFDGPPESVKPESLRLPREALPAIDAGLPASLLGRRPDLRAAELRLRSTLASADATRLSYYPGFSLTGSLGTSSTSLIDVLENPVASLGLGLVLPFLNWDQTQLNIEVSKLDYEEAVVSFRQSLYQALGDVENALASRRHYANEVADREKALAAARMAEGLYESRFRAGAVSLQSWLDSQESRRSAESSLAQSRLNALSAYITLCQALGGSPG
ncbi:efflux transporter outer membrane subunit [Zavarzinia sp.]|uniref:efflux transporter outer membrane subunit n=1 Tax=Zavarzinia sp. TaxID=2027920 RepID=UPI003BB7A346